MSRTIEIGGKKVTIERGLAVPPKKEFRGREKGDFRLLLESMELGESVVLPLTKKEYTSKSATMSTTAKSLGDRAFMARPVDGGYRIFCVAKAKSSPTPCIDPIKVGGVRPNANGTW